MASVGRSTWLWEADQRPEPRRRFARHYAQIHVLLGWLFVPFAVASITGILR